MRDALAGWDGRGQFAGHETFPLRLLWLRKAYDTVRKGAPTRAFHEPSAIAALGVGRNMAVSMRFWAVASGFIRDEGKTLSPTPLGKAVLSAHGHDPFVEQATTIWLAHWHIASDPRCTTTIYFAFNAISTLEFDSRALARSIEDLVRARSWRATAGTVRRDVEVFIRSYVRKDEASLEDAAEPLLAELGLVREVHAGSFEFVRGPKPTLSDGAFAFALNAFWRSRFPATRTLSAEQVCYAPGSPGRVFKLDEDSVVRRLMRLDKCTRGAFLWTETAGLRQVLRRRELDQQALLDLAYAAVA